MHHLCRAGRPIITPACEYWSTAPECVCYFKMLRPVIIVLMIVIATAIGSVGLFRACRHGWRGSQPEHTCEKWTLAQQEGLSEGGWRHIGVLMRVRAALGPAGSNLQWGSLPAVCAPYKWKLVSQTHLYHRQWLLPLCARMYTKQL